MNGIHVQEIRYQIAHFHVSDYILISSWRKQQLKLSGIGAVKADRLTEVQIKPAYANVPVSYYAPGNFRPSSRTSS